ncbi:hypothetical protein GA0116948_112106 [Chitinophaga costaii]|uniref:Carboxypeptidase regulatory-like domain-containing protein n=1 Tax=Chitinophaga costaii TaxID=1335309 RepID=A0A1C4F8T2_9BACT|nr:carboxypeptidase-like regulatory domain-containing protein [Chitinophaga costaii]PUZ21189.1 carboxypeptidase regulatory-like domain-containing protein [Chitinophaga costaii]SCC52222.1 hypothetical protein GA0116948_112106 [Chitinophaga costaii]
MKHIRLAMLMALLAGILYSFHTASGSISGKILPPDGASEVWAFAGSDTLKTAVSNGVLSFENVTAGTYTIIVNAKSPYKDATIQNVKVEDDKVTNLGDIKLDQ